MAENTTAASDSSKEVVFPQGIPGFEDQTRFRLHYSDTESGRVYWMESCVCPEITFTLVDPELYALNYVLELTDEDETLLQVDSPEQVLVFLMVWKPEGPGQEGQSGLHANIAGPILINVDKRLGMQKIIPRPRMALNIST